MVQAHTAANPGYSVLEWFGVDPALQRYSISSWINLQTLDVSAQSGRQGKNHDGRGGWLPLHWLFHYSALNQPVILEYPLTWYSCWLIDEVLTKGS